MAGTIRVTIPQSPSCSHHLKARVNHSCKQSVLEALVKIPNLPEFLFNPAVLHQFLKAFQPFRRKVVCLKRLERRLRRKHAGLEREMNALETHRIQESSGIAND